MSGERERRWTRRSPSSKSSSPARCEATAFSSSRCVECQGSSVRVPTVPAQADKQASELAASQAAAAQAEAQVVALTQEKEELQLEVWIDIDAHPAETTLSCRWGAQPRTATRLLETTLSCEKSLHWLMRDSRSIACSWKVCSRSCSSSNSRQQRGCALPVWSESAATDRDAADRQPEQADREHRAAAASSHRPCNQGGEPDS